MSERCAGLEVHQKTVVACALMGPAGSDPELERRTWATTTSQLLERNDWLLKAGRHTRGDGIDRPVLEAGVGGAGRAVRPDAVQRGAGQTGAGPEDGSKRRGVDRRLAAARTAEEKFRAAAAAAGPAGADALPGAGVGGSKRGQQSASCWRAPISSWAR